MELECLVRERKALRERQKEQRSLNAQRGGRSREDELDVLLKSKKGNLYLELL